MKSKHSKKDKGAMIDKLKDNLASIAALIAAVAAIGGGFVKYGEITTRLNNIEASQGVDFKPVEDQIANVSKNVGDQIDNVSKSVDETKLSINGVAKNVKENKESISSVDTKAEVNSKEIELLKLQIKEIQINSKNPLGG